ncbi:hypothetical protein GGR58DRAFT_512999 [Xylaria digitata]|nr:hypothetical protein GGR58DRAFT_512999 [Xylaria digitata]
MFAAKTLAMFIAAAAVPLAAASPTNNTVIQADFWGQFCDDTGCSQNCSGSVRISNPGCLNQIGRQSIRFHGPDIGRRDYSLVASPSGDCPCQDACLTIPTNITCWDISNHQNALSFRFISGHCDSDDC